MAMPQRTLDVGERKTTSQASPMVFTRRPPKPRTTGPSSASWRRSRSSFSACVCRAVVAVKPWMSVNITARFSVRMGGPKIARRPRRGAVRSGTGRAALEMKFRAGRELELRDAVATEPAHVDEGVDGDADRPVSEEREPRPEADRAAGGAVVAEHEARADPEPRLHRPTPQEAEREPERRLEDVRRAGVVRRRELARAQRQRDGPAAEAELELAADRQRLPAEGPVVHAPSERAVRAVEPGRGDRR